MPPTQRTVPLAFDRAINRFRQSLTDDEKKDFSHLTSMQDVWDLVDELQNEQASRDSLQNMSRIKPFIDGMAQYAGIIEVFVQAKPEIMSLIWGPLKLLLQLASKTFDAFDKILDAIGRIGENLPRFRRFAEIFSYSDQIQQVIGTVYEDIMEFYRRALKFFRRRAWKIVFSLTWTTFEARFGLILSNLQRHQDLVDSEARAEDIVQSHKAREDELKRVEEHQKGEMSRRMKDVMDRLKPPNTEDDKEKAKGLKKPGTGNWLLETPGIKSWISGRAKQLIWLTGKPGSGKTILSYTVLEHLEQKKTAANSPHLVLYFFCSYRQGSSNLCLDILSALIYQIVSQRKDLLAYVYEELMKPLSVPMLKRLFYDLLEASVSPSEYVYIIIDGLDELPDSQRKIFLPILRELRSQKQLNSVSRVLVASRDLGDIRNGFGKNKFVEISTEGKNTDDILQYIFSESQRVVEYLGLDAQMEKTISDSLCARANGMFLWVHLVIESLLLQSRPKEVRETLEKFPEGLGQAYKRILYRIEELSTNQKANARKILEWMTCASRTLKIGELEDAVSINPGEFTVDEENRLLRDRLRYLCGPIVEFSRGAITFVHFTAKEYLLNPYSGEPFINRLAAHLNISLVCATYQCFHCFESALSRDSEIRFVLNGDLRLFDYVQSNWLEHIKEFCKLSPDRSQIEQLSNALRELFQKRVARVASMDFLGENSRVRDFGCFEPDIETELMRTQEYREGLIQKMTSFGSCDEVTRWCNENNPLTVIRGGQKLQHVLEGMLNEQPPDPAKIEKLQTLYGENLYMCSYQFCQMSSGEGFKTWAERKTHEDKHSRPYKCQVQGCFYDSLGFASKSLLQRHTKKYHFVMAERTSALAVEVLANGGVGVEQLPFDFIPSSPFSSSPDSTLDRFDLDAFLYGAAEFSTVAIDRLLESTEPHIFPGSDQPTPAIIKEIEETIESCGRDLSSPKDYPIYTSPEIERILRQLSSQLKTWRKLVKAFYFVTHDIPTVKELVINILHCREQYSDDFETPIGKYTMSEMMLEDTRRRLTKCFAYIQNAAKGTQKEGQKQVQQQADPDLVDEPMKDVAENSGGSSGLEITSSPNSPSRIDTSTHQNLSGAHSGGFNGEGGEGFSAAIQSEFPERERVFQILLHDLKQNWNPQGWQQELTPNERAINIIEIASLKPMRTSAETEYTIKVAKIFEHTTYDKARNKADYQMQCEKRMSLNPQLQESELVDTLTSTQPSQQTNPPLARIPQINPNLVLSQGQVAIMDNKEVPRQILGQLSNQIPLQFKTWGQIKTYLSTNNVPSQYLDTLRIRQSQHYQLLVRAKAQMMRREAQNAAGVPQPQAPAPQPLNPSTVALQTPGSPPQPPSLQQPTEYAQEQKERIAVLVKLLEEERGSHEGRQPLQLQQTEKEFLHLQLSDTNTKNMIRRTDLLLTMFVLLGGAPKATEELIRVKNLLTLQYQANGEPKEVFTLNAKELAECKRSLTKYFAFVKQSMSSLHNRDEKKAMEVQMRAQQFAPNSPWPTRPRVVLQQQQTQLLSKNGIGFTQQKAQKNQKDPNPPRNIYQPVPEDWQQLQNLGPSQEHQELMTNGANPNQFTPQKPEAFVDQNPTAYQSSRTAYSQGLVQRNNAVQNFQAQRLDYPPRNAPTTMGPHSSSSNFPVMPLPSRRQPTSFTPRSKEPLGMPGSTIADDLGIFEPRIPQSSSHSDQLGLFGGFKSGDNNAADHMDNFEKATPLPEEQSQVTTLSEAEKAFWYDGAPQP